VDRRHKNGIRLFRAPTAAYLRAWRVFRQLQASMMMAMKTCRDLDTAFYDRLKAEADERAALQAQIMATTIDEKCLFGICVVKLL
jgi:hypothetical protein